MIDTPTEPGYYWARPGKKRVLTDPWEPFEISVDTFGGYFCGSDIFVLTEELEFHSKLVRPGK